MNDAAAPVTDTTKQLSMLTDEPSCTQLALFPPGTGENPHLHDPPPGTWGGNIPLSDAIARCLTCPYLLPGGICKRWQYRVTEEDGTPGWDYATITRISACTIRPFTTEKEPTPCQH